MYLLLSSFLITGCVGTASPTALPSNPPSTSLPVTGPVDTADTGDAVLPLPMLQTDVPVGGGFPHVADHLYPTTVTPSTTAIVVVHGGAGTKHAMAYSLGIKADDAPAYTTGYDAAYLDDHDVALIFPQGLAIPAHPGATTWSNTIMTSGEDDLAMFAHLAAELRATGFSRVVMMGHSMGGTMANRLWCESPTVFDAYGSSAGPRSNDLDAACSPAVYQPYLHVTGMNDRVIQLVEDRAGALPDVDHHDDPTLTLDPFVRQTAPSAFVHAPPEFRNELTSFPERVAAMCGASAPAPVDAPATGDWQTRTYDACGGSLRMVLLAGRDHCLGGEDAPGTFLCDVPLTPWGTTEHLDRFVDFFASVTTP